MRRLYFVSDGPASAEVLMNTLSGYGGQRLELTVASWTQSEKEDKFGREIPFRADYVGRMVLFVEKFSWLASESDPRRLIPGGVPVVNLFAKVGSLEISASERYEQDDLYYDLRNGTSVKILYDYCSSSGVVAHATGREFDDEVGRWYTWSMSPRQWLYFESRVGNSKERKTPEEYQERLRKLNLPEGLILNQNLMEALRMT